MLSNSILEKYVKDIENIPDLSEEEEKHLFEKAKKGDKKAKEKILLSYLKLVLNIVKFSYNENENSILDLISEGNIGLMKAIEKYEPEKGVKFSTYASWWIRQAIKRYLKGESNLIKIPSHVNEILRCFFKKLNLNKSITLNDKTQTAEKIGVDIETIEEYLSKYQDWVSLTQVEDDKTCLEEIIEDKKVIDPLAVYEKKEIFQLLLDWLKVLTDKERKVIIYRYGLSQDNPMTLEEIGKRLKLTRERIRQIELKAINKLRFYLLKKKSLFF